MLDFLGRELHVGDKVVYLFHVKSSSHYVKTKITGFTPKKVYIDSGKCVEPHKLIKYTE
jgi:hypothetical protein